MEQMYVESFPKHIIIYIDQPKIKKKHVTTLKMNPRTIDLTEYASPENKNPNGNYCLTAVIAHTYKKSLNRGMYTAIVKKKLSKETDKKSWVTYKDGKGKEMKSKHVGQESA